LRKASVPGFSHGLSVCSREAVLTVEFANRTTGLIVSSAFEDGPRAGGGDTNTFWDGGEFGDKVPTRRGVEGEAVGCFDSDRGSDYRPEAGFKACGYPFSLSSGVHFVEEIHGRAVEDMHGGRRKEALENEDAD
jgi:hypothetical protein